MIEKTKLIYGLYFKNTETNKYELCAERKNEKALETLLYKIKLISEQDLSRHPTWYGRTIKPSFNIKDYKIRFTKIKIQETTVEDRWVK